jgi:RNA exonuclease NGL2
VLIEDFNSTPWGMTYAALTQRPIELAPRQQEELKESVAYDFRQVKDEEEEIEEDGDFTPLGASTPAEREIKNNATASVIPIWKTKEYLEQQLFVQEEKPLNITPATMENNALVLQHHISNPLLQSLYSTGLKACQPDNAINAFGEPPFTNWAQGYRETLDYIFVLKRENAGKVKLLGLLKMPKREEMGEGEPREGRFPSDHVCEMVEIELS